MNGEMSLSYEYEYVCICTYWIIAAKRIGTSILVNSPVE